MDASRKSIDTEKMISLLRERAIDLNGRRLLVSKLGGSDQEGDISLPPNCAGLGRIRHFKNATAEGWPANPLPIEPARRALGIDSKSPEMTAQVFQNAACPWRCWYCFVPFNLLAADLRRSEWVTADRLVELYTLENEKPLIIDLSGGSPDLVPEWTLWMMESLHAAGLSDVTYLWSDDNLSTSFLFEKLSPAELEAIQNYRNYGRVCCFKGFDAESFQFNTQADASGFDRQFEIMRRMLQLDIDLYGYITLTSENGSNITSKMSDFFDRLQSLCADLPLRIIPLRIGVYGPVSDRVNQQRKKSLEIQEKAIACWNDEVIRRFSARKRMTSICDISVQGG